MTQLTMVEEASENINEYQTLIKKLYQSIDLSTANKMTTNTEEILNKIIKVDQKLQESIKRVRLHQEIQSRIENHQITLLNYNEIVLDVVNTLNKSSNELEDLLIESEKIRNVYNDGVDCKDLLNYAQRVAKHTLDPLEPPIPQDVHMRMSQLFQEDKVSQLAQTTETQQDHVAMEIEMFNEPQVQVEKTEEDDLDLDLF
ncbi:hypothetical protein BC833DRAFT_597072 [Globomyces pollinis-pini]|nr:hypothetical protein BC833DRAFT_597072 [Globomyces pollinis-pini]KAJ2995180.1 hypothetical protein HDV02_001006 [Globomyces sp. JEL0801]